MKVIVVYKKQSEHGRMVEDYLKDFSRTTGKLLEEMDPDSHEGSAFCENYDIVEYPTLVAVDDVGVMQNMWRGALLPTISEVSYYVQ